MTSLFEGKCGPSVDEIPESIKIHYDEDDDEFHEFLERYEKDLLFRKSIGPNIPLWARTGYSSFLSGLQIDLDFGHYGNVRGICTYIEKPVDEYQIEWRHGPVYNEETSFISKHSNKYGDNAQNIIGMYVQEKSNKAHYDWIQYIEEDEGLMKESLLDFLKTVQGAPEGTKFVNWKQPFHLDNDDPDFINIVDEDKWYFTMAKLNDPRMAHVYGGDGYSTLSVLTLYLICVHFHGFYEPLPIMVTKDNEEIFKLSDMMCRQLSGSSSSYGGGTGYGQLMTFERIITRITTEYPPNEAKTNYNVWKGGYHNAQALMLVLSSKFEEAMWDYDMVDDPIRVEKLIGNFCRVFGSYMSPENAPPSDEAREQLQRDLNLNDEHLRAGVFFYDAKSEQKDLFTETVARCLKKEE